tara:strand:- start:725 stop:949 length:225 start_codon:yes stop_codon:yes gene_type:complete
MQFTLNLTHIATSYPANEPMSGVESLWWLASIEADDSKNYSKAYWLQDRVLKSITWRTGVDYTDGNWEIDGASS